MDTILVTGGAGFIGSHVVEALLPFAKVMVVDNYSGSYSSDDNLAAVRNHKNLSLQKVDITDAAALAKVFEQHHPDKVIHMAAATGVRSSIERPDYYAKVNVVGTAAVLQLAAKHSVRQFVFGSSSSVYGNSEVPFTESAATDKPLSPYAATKKAGELLCYAYHSLYGMPTTCLRFFTVYGERGRPDMAVYKFTKNIAAKKPVQVFGEGTSRDYTYVSDIVEGVRLALQKPLPFDIINLGNSHPVDLAALIDLIQEEVGQAAILDRQPMQKGDVQATYADIGRAEQLLGWKPKVSIQQGIARFVRWFRHEH